MTNSQQNWTLKFPTSYRNSLKLKNGSSVLVYIVRCPQKRTITQDEHSFGLRPLTKQIEIFCASELRKFAFSNQERSKFSTFWINFFLHILEFPEISWNYFISRKFPGQTPKFPKISRISRRVETGNTETINLRSRGESLYTSIRIK